MSRARGFGPAERRGRDKPFAVYDIETSTDLRRVYLVGWFDGVVYKYWESALLAPDEDASAISQFCLWWFSESRRTPLYAHNGGNFDHLYVLKWLLHFRPDARIEFVPTQSSILLMTVTLDGRVYEFRDSMRLMVGGLDALAKALLGHGKLDGIDYETLHVDPRRYEYLKRDCTDLWNCMLKFQSVVEDRLGGSVGLTAAATAIKTLQTGYLSRSIDGLEPRVEALVRKGYYGGRTEVFHTGGDFAVATPLRCYDINSMYVWALGQELPTDYIGTIGDCRRVRSAEGFLDCQVTTAGADILARRFPILPYRHDGKLLFPSGRFRGVWSTVELRLAVAHGYRITHVYGGEHFRMSRVFDAYVNTLYKLRDKGADGYDPTVSLIAKLLGNSTYGKFGTNRDREKIHVRPPLGDVISRGMRPLQGPLELPVYVEDVQCDASYVLPHLAAWVTALARVKLWGYIASCWPSRVYYCDTDSVFTTAELPIGNGLGQMKCEYGDIVRAEFFAPKVYRLTHADGHQTTRAKGFSRFGAGLRGLDFSGLMRGEGQTCSAFSKLRTVLRGDFGLILRQKRAINDSPKRRFLADGSSNPIMIDERKSKDESQKGKG